MLKLFIEDEMQKLGASRRFKGFWVAVDMVEMCCQGEVVGEALKKVAGKERISTALVHERIRGMIQYMQKQGTEQYTVLWGNGKKPTPNELICRISEIVKR